jgi:hypothetical protein
MSRPTTAPVRRRCAFPAARPERPPSRDGRGVGRRPSLCAASLCSYTKGYRRTLLKVNASQGPVGIRSHPTGGMSGCANPVLHPITACLLTHSMGITRLLRRIRRAARRHPSRPGARAKEGRRRHGRARQRQDRLPRPRHDRPLLELHDLIFLTADKGRLQALLRFRVVKRDRRLILPLLLAVIAGCS